MVHQHVKLGNVIIDEIDFILLDNANSEFSVSVGGEVKTIARRGLWCC